MPQIEENDRLRAHMNLLYEADTGKLDHFTCPDCGLPNVAVWFTHPAEDEYRTWFICSHCEFHTRAQNVEKPKFFSQDRCRHDLEKADRAILNTSIFKKPASN